MWHLVDCWDQHLSNLSLDDPYLSLLSWSTCSNSTLHFMGAELCLHPPNWFLSSRQCFVTLNSLFLFSCSILSLTVQQLHATLHIHFCTQARARFFLSSQKTYPHRWTLCIPQINRTACKITCIALRFACMKEILDIYVKIIALHIHIMVRERMMPIRNSGTGSHIPG